jgi:hypothetical protein
LYLKLKIDLWNEVKKKQYDVNYKKIDFDKHFLGSEQCLWAELWDLGVGLDSFRLLAASPV